MIERMVLPPVLCVVLAAPALASGWDDFVARCLDPYEHLSPAVTEGLAAVPDSALREDRLMFEAVAGGAVMVLEVTPEDGERACGLQVPAGAVPCVAAFEDWRRTAISAGRYQTEEDGTLLSTEWIEPRLRMAMKRDGQGVSFRIVETDLES